MHGQICFTSGQPTGENDVICKKLFVCLDCWRMASECIVVKIFSINFCFFDCEMIDSHVVIRK